MNKRGIFIILVFMFSILLGISSVSAADNTTSEIVGMEETDIAGVDEINDELNLENNAADENEVSSANPKTFTDLNNTINGNGDDEVYLDSNYTFELGSGAGFKDGVTINRAVTVYGNGFTIDGDNIARIFKITNSNVILRDIIFVNGKGNDGGAINGACTVINCTFKNNTATSAGGAIYTESGGAIYNSTFINNTAGTGGGAMYTWRNGYAYNCNFTNNKGLQYAGAINGFTAENCNFTNNIGSMYGGAVYDCNVLNCMFINNTASYGGAMYSSGMGGGNAENCIFIDNSADNYGGAMYKGSAVNCTFANNKANDNGGAMYGDENKATNCQFINNTATNGGATYKITANNCNFTQNTATEYGGAMYGGTASNCIFTNNKAGISGDNTYNTNVPKPVFTVSNYSSIYNSRDKLVFSFTTPSGLPINDANITIRVYKNNNLIGTYYALSGDGWVVSLDAGSYIAVCSVENQAYDVDSANVTLTITKDSTKLTSTAITTVYNGNKYLVVTLKDSKNRPISNVAVSINLNGVKTLTTDKNGQVKLSINNIAPKKYTAKITFNGNNNYLKSTTTAKVTVKKATPKITAKKKTFKKAKKIKKYSITLKVNGKAMKNVKLTIKIGKKKFTAKTNSKGKATFKIKKLTKKGKYKAKITYKGNKYYYKVTKKVRITIK